MWDQDQNVVSPDFIQFFDSYRQENPNIWDSSLCLLAPLHWETVKQGYIRVIPEGGFSENLDFIENVVKRDGANGLITLSLLYMHKSTGLRKHFSLKVFKRDEEDFITFCWNDRSTSCEGNPPKIKIATFILNPLGNCVNEVFRIKMAWKLGVLARYELISERNEKLEYLQNELVKAQTPWDKTFLNRLLAQCNASKISALQNLQQQSWNLSNSHLVFVATHIHKSLVNYPSKLQFIIGGPGAAKCYELDNGTKHLVACYKHEVTGTIRRLRMMEQIDETGGSFSAQFGNHEIRLGYAEYKRYNQDENDNLWKLTALVRVKLYWEHTVDKLIELIGTFVSAETIEKRNFVKGMLVELISSTAGEWCWKRILLGVDEANLAFKEKNFYNVLLVEYITRERDLRELDLLRTAWKVDEPGAIHLIAFYIHYALKLQHEKVEILCGVDNNDFKAMRIQHQDGTITLEAEYKWQSSKVTKRLKIIETNKNLGIVAILGNNKVVFNIRDCVRGSMWMRTLDNCWKLDELNHKVSILLQKQQFLFNFPHNQQNYG